jgi:membrane fusion protein (multidrug efflux system)
VIDEGLKTGEKIVLEGILQVRDGDQVDYEFQAPEEVLAHLKYHAQ